MNKAIVVTAHVDQVYVACKGNMTEDDCNQLISWLHSQLKLPMDIQCHRIVDRGAMFKITLQQGEHWHHSDDIGRAIASDFRGLYRSDMFLEFATEWDRIPQKYKAA